jgi:hypothetical protein
MDQTKHTPEEKFPEITHQTWVDPRTRSRKKPMEVLVIGMMRTGTLCKWFSSIETKLEHRLNNTLFAN